MALTVTLTLPLTLTCALEVDGHALREPRSRRGGRQLARSRPGYCARRSGQSTPPRVARAIADVPLAQGVRTDADEGAALHRSALYAVEVAPEGEDDGEVDQEGDEQREAALYPRVPYRRVHLVRDRARARARARDAG